MCIFSARLSDHCATAAGHGNRTSLLTSSNKASIRTAPHQQRAPHPSDWSFDVHLALLLNVVCLRSAHLREPGGVPCHSHSAHGSELRKWSQPCSVHSFPPATFTSARFPTLSCRTHRSAQTCLAIFAHGASTPSTVAGSPNPSTLLFPSIAARRPCQTISSEGTVHTGRACQRSARSGAGEEKKNNLCKEARLASQNGSERKCTLSCRRRGCRALRLTNPHCRSPAVGRGCARDMLDTPPCCTCRAPW